MIAEFLMDFALQVISALGYAGIFLLMLAESTVLPVPSELVLPFAGYLVSQGNFGLIEVALASLLGSIAGSLISYYIGKFIGKEMIIRFGKKVFLEEKHLELAHEWFNKFGEKTIFICRFVPAIRHVISLPAGIAEMDLKKFILYTAFGALCWNSILIFSGIMLQKNWEIILEYTQIIDLIIILGIVFLAGLFILNHLRNKGR